MSCVSFNKRKKRNGDERQDYTRLRKYRQVVRSSHDQRFDTCVQRPNIS
jgi:hypothetical protein